MLRAGDLRRVPLRDVAVETCHVPVACGTSHYEMSPWKHATCRRPATRPITRCRRWNMLRAGDLRRIPLRDTAVEIYYLPVTCDASHYEMPPLKYATCLGL